MNRFLVVVVEKKTDAPQRCESDYYENDSAAHGQLPAENPTYNIKTEKADGTPVQTADNGNRQSDFIKYGLH